MDIMDIIMLLAAFGALIQFSIGVWQKKVSNPDFIFQPIYISVAVIGALSAALAMQNVDIVEINVFSIFSAILMGMGGTAGVEKMVKAINGKPKIIVE